MKHLSEKLLIPIGCGGDEEVIFENWLSPAFFELPEGDELMALSDIAVSGKAYWTSGWIMVEANAKVIMSLPCSMCNERTECTVELPLWEQTFPEERASEGTLDVTEELRGALLLEVPSFVKCGGDECKNIEDVRQYLVSSDPMSDDDGEERNQPFLSLL